MPVGNALLLPGRKHYDSDKELDPGNTTTTDKIEINYIICTVFLTKLLKNEVGRCFPTVAC